jgi:hypothetical protein
VRQRIGPARAPARVGVVRREDAAEEGDQAERIAPVVADDIGVPPGVAAVRDRPVEARSASALAAASFPLSATIGTPAPGCALPPVRYRPGSFVLDPALAKGDVIPWEAAP